MNRNLPYYFGKDGVWFLYYYGDSGITVTSIHEKSEFAILAHTTGDHIGFWPLGMTVSEAVTWFEGQKPTEPEPEDTAAADPDLLKDVTRTLSDLDGHYLSVDGAIDKLAEQGIVFRRKFPKSTES